MPLYQSNVKSDYLRRVQQLMELPDHTQQDIMYHNHLIQSAVAPTFHDAHSIQNKKTSLVCNSNLVSPLVTIEEPMKDYLGSIQHQVNNPLHGETLPEHMDDTQKDIKMYSKKVRKCTEKIIGLKQKIEDAKRANNQSELNSLLQIKLSTEKDLMNNQRYKAMLDRRYEGLIEYDKSHQKKCTIS
jgi:vacuolar-type H+-ATPase subunit I/STV1